LSEFRQTQLVDSLLALKDSDAYCLFLEEANERINNLNVQANNFLREHEDRKAGERLAKADELKYAVGWLNRKLRELKTGGVKNG